MLCFQVGQGSSSSPGLSVFSDFDLLMARKKIRNFGYTGSGSRNQGRREQCYTLHIVCEHNVPGAEVFYPLNSAEVVPEDLLCDRNVLECL